MRPLRPAREGREHLAMRPMRQILAVVLALAVAAFGVAAHTAPQRGAKVVLCVGGALVETRLDAPDGAPGETRTTICPDAAQALMSFAGLAPPPELTAAPLRVAARLRPAETRLPVRPEMTGGGPRAPPA